MAACKSPEPEGDRARGLVQTAMVQLHRSVVEIHGVNELGVRFALHRLLKEDWQML